MDSLSAMVGVSAWFTAASQVEQAKFVASLPALFAQHGRSETLGTLVMDALLLEHDGLGADLCVALLDQVCR